MNIEIIAIGDEVLSGKIANTNAAFISQELLKAGFDVVRHMTLPDEEILLYEGLSEALHRSQLVITTGGLGPTCDDLTRKTAAKLFDSDLIYNDDIAKDLQSRYGDRLISLQDQATVIAKAKILKNSVGTAPGSILRSDHATLILLPGVPPEMKMMFLEQVLPFLKENYRVSSREYNKHLHFFNLSESAIDPALRQLQMQCPNVKFGIYPSQGVVSIHLSSKAEKEEEALQMLSVPFEMLAQQFAKHRFESQSGTLEGAIHQIFTEKKWTLSVAESCTGGRVAAYLTKLPGSSKYFMGSLVTYSNEMKMQLLGVSQHLLEKEGAVSEAVAKQMLQGLLELTQCDFGVAVTGIAGPDGGTAAKPVGTIWGAVGAKGKDPRVWKFQAYGNREMIMEKTVNALLAQLYLYVVA